MPPRPKIPTPPAPVPPKNSAEVRTASFKDRVAAFETKFQESLDSVTKTMQEQGQRNDDRHNELKEMVNKQMADQTKIIELMSEKHALEKKQMEETTQAQLKQMQQKCALEIKQMEDGRSEQGQADSDRVQDLQRAHRCRNAEGTATPELHQGECRLCQRKYSSGEKSEG